MFEALNMVFVVWWASVKEQLKITSSSRSRGGNGVLGGGMATAAAPGLFYHVMLVV
jgi:hypothetical protein